MNDGCRGRTAPSHERRAPEEFSTARLQARRLLPGDLTELCLMHGDARVMAWLGGVRSESRSRDYLAANLAHWDIHKFGLWMLRDAGGKFAGRAGLRHIAVDDKDEIELAYALMPEYWGRGIATEIALALLDIGFLSLALTTVVVLTLPDNNASRRVAEKAGFAFERFATVEGLRHRLYRIGAPSRPQTSA